MSRDPRRFRTRAAPALLLLLAGMAGAAGAASLEAEIDRTEATLDDRLVLTLTVTGSGSALPTLPTLAEFEVVPAGQSKQWNFIDGRASSSVSYRFVLLPRREGSFVIGPATVEIDGAELTSQPISVRILASGAPSSPSRDLFITTEVSTTSPYVGQQVLFIWRLYRRPRIADARLDPLEFSGFLAEDLGEVREFETVVNGQTYGVSEFRKALFPQEQGELVIPETRLTCQVPVSGRRRGSGIMSDFFGRPSQTTVLRSDPIPITVRPLPEAPAGFSGLVGQFEVSGQLSQQEAKVGESVTLTLKVTGRGNVQVIPQPPLPELPTVKIYDDKPAVKIERKPSGLSGSRTFRKVLVPQVAGDLELPRARLIYFDPEVSGFLTAAVPAMPLRVLPSDESEELRLTETLAPNTGKVAVRILADDILPSHAGLDGLGGPAPPTPLLAAMLTAPPFVYLAALLAARRRRRFREDASLERRRRALALARRRLRQIERGDGDATEALSRCLREFLGDKLGLEGIALTAADARRHLTERGLPGERVDEVGRLLDRLEAAHYGAAGLAAGLPGEVSELVRRLDREL